MQNDLELAEVLDTDFALRAGEALYIAGDAHSPAEQAREIRAVAGAELAGIRQENLEAVVRRFLENYRCDLRE